MFLILPTLTFTGPVFCSCIIISLLSSVYFLPDTKIVYVLLCLFPDTGHSNQFDVFL